MMYAVQLTRQAERDVALLAPYVATRILDRVEWLALYADEMIHRRLKGEQWGKAYKLGAGDYRVIYQLVSRPADMVYPSEARVASATSILADT